MSQRWDDHINAINALIASNPVQRAIPAPPVVAPTGPTLNWHDLAGLLGDSWQGGANGGQVGMPGGIDAGGKPGDMGNMSPGMLGAIGGGLLGLALGGPAGALTGAGLGYKGSGFLGGLLGGKTGTAQPTEPGSIGGDYGPSGSGPNAFGGGMGNAMAAGMGLGVGGLGAMSGNEIMGFGGFGGGVDGGTDGPSGPSGPSDSGGQSGAGDMGLGGGQFQRGGYTGAGTDGVVQPSRPAGTVHEGELVIPWHVVRGLLSR